MKALNPWFIGITVCLLAANAAYSQNKNWTVEPCGFLPHCVSSVEKEGSFFYIAPLAVAANDSKAMERLKTVIGATPGAVLVSEAPDRLSYEFTTPLMRFTDDVQFVFNKALNEINVRSSSRLGISDLGANAKRVEQIRKAFEQTKTSAQ